MVGEIAWVVNARPSVWIGAASPWTGQPGSSVPFGRIACTYPSAVANTSSFRLSPSRSANAGEDSPSLGRTLGKPGSMSWSRCR